MGKEVVRRMDGTVGRMNKEREARKQGIEGNEGRKKNQRESAGIGRQVN